MSFELTSIVESYGKVIDCRCLSFAFEFYQLSDKLVVDLSTDLVVWLDELLKEGFISKRFDMNYKSTTAAKALSQLKEMVQVRHGWSYGQAAYVVSSTVYNLKTMNSYIGKRRTELMKGDVHSGLSVDYPLYWKELFPNGREDSDSIKQKIQCIFREENRKEMSLYNLSDVQAFVSICPYQNDCTLFYGAYFALTA